MERADHFYAEVSCYLEFTQPVPFSEGSHYYEGALCKADGSTNKGAFGRAVRVLPDQEYDLIWRAGFSHVIGLAPRDRPAPDIAEEPLAFKVTEEAAAYNYDGPFDEDRRIVEQLVSRPFRDRAFTAAVKSAYGDTCAVTGLKIINGGGRTEVQAAQIRPVADRGSDSVRNGIALSGTIHWMFDRGLLAINDDYRLMVAKEYIPEAARQLLPADGHLRLPNREDLRPHPVFLAFHRETFKG